MIRKLLCVALALGSSAGVLLAADAFTGTWKLDVAKSSFASDDPAPRELTLTFTERGGHLTQTMSRRHPDQHGVDGAGDWRDRHLSRGSGAERRRLPEGYR